jgi:hypothetical protein
MADPIITPQLLAAAGAGLGALSKPRNPLQGALLGGIAGYTGGTALGLGAPTAASGGGLTLGTSGANVAKLGAETTGLGAGVSSAAPGTMGAGSGLSLNPFPISSASNVSSISNAANAADALNAASTAPEWFGLGQLGKSATGLKAAPAFTSAPTIGNYSLSTAPAATNYSLVAPSAVTSPPSTSFMDKVAMSVKNSYENPMQSFTAVNAANSLLQPEPMNQAPAMQLQAGRGVKPYDFVASMDPYRPSVIGSPQISLLG